MDEKEIDKKYIDFIENLIGQIQPLLPKDVNKLQEDYLVSNIRKSAMLMASGLAIKKLICFVLEFLRSIGKLLCKKSGTQCGKLCMLV